MFRSCRELILCGRTSWKTFSMCMIKILIQNSAKQWGDRYYQSKKNNTSRVYYVGKTSVGSRQSTSLGEVRKICARNEAPKSPKIATFGGDIAVCQTYAVSYIWLPFDHFTPKKNVNCFFPFFF